MLQIIGGMIIGAAATIMLLFNGRVTGISGILAGILKPIAGDTGWKLLFILGLFLGGAGLELFFPSAFTLISKANLYDYALAGFLVGFGTLMGNGCTSGHGVCGISRLSARSILATSIFIVAGITGVILFRLTRGGI